jgi:phage terminase large subunit-like protein
VHATRGKAVRAEPIAALYEQGRIFHVRPFLELEDELCTYNPNDTSAKSPDRMDALVWAMSELFVEPQYVPRNFENLPPA